MHLMNQKMALFSHRLNFPLIPLSAKIPMTRKYCYFIFNANILARSTYILILNLKYQFPAS